MSGCVSPPGHSARNSRSCSNHFRRGFGRHEILSGNQVVVADNVRLPVPIENSGRLKGTVWVLVNLFMEFGNSN